MAPASVMLRLGLWSSISPPRAAVVFWAFACPVGMCKGFKEKIKILQLCARVLRNCGDMQGYVQGF